MAQLVADELVNTIIQPVYQTSPNLQYIYKMESSRVVLHIGQIS